MTYAYLKLGAFDNEVNDLTLDVIPLQLISVGVNVQRTVPSMAIPLSSIALGESLTVGIDLGMASKVLTLNGVITSTTLKRSHSKNGDSPRAVIFTPQEIAQMIASNVDSSGLAKYQTMNELTVFIDSAVSSTYTQRGTTNPLGTIQIPFNFASRGVALEKDNEGVIQPISTISDVDRGGDGLSGFIESFDFSFNAEATDIEFNMTFKQATIFP